ncbi:MAG: cation transporter [Candidatus Bathyarchaeota archaeon]|nr:cation transporter [Candidatus Termiticorpusculum sp.]
MAQTNEKNKEKRHKINCDLVEAILMILHKDGPQTLEELGEKTTLHTTDFNRQGKRLHIKRKKQLGLIATCEEMTSKNWIKLVNETKYELTYTGIAEAQETIKAYKQGAHRIQTQLLSPSAAARNTTIGYTVVSILKTVTGLLSGSVGLIADGADAIVGTIASVLVWAGIKFKKEIISTLTVISLLFIAAIALFYNSITSIFTNIAGIAHTINMPYTVITIEIITIIAMFILFYYQRLIGRKNKNFALISHSIDSKNSIYSAIVVIIGIVFSIFGIYWIDAIVGTIIAIRITLDGINLSREASKTMKGETPEYSKYKLPFEKQISQRRTDIFQHWILYTIYNDKQSTKQEIIDSLEKAFQPNYMPTLLTEITSSEDTNFEVNFTELITPLIKNGCITTITEKPDTYKLTKKGNSYIKSTTNTKHNK